jgi:hypothetical protein
MIPIDAIMCPYCNAALWENQSESASFQTPSYKQQPSVNGNFSSLYSPPYSGKEQPTHEEFPSSMKKKAESFKSAQRINTPATGLDDTYALEKEDSQVGQKSIFWAILLLSLAVNLVMLGLLQLFFSDGGFLRLEWRSSYWFIYCLISLPLFYLGIRKVNQLS